LEKVEMETTEKVVSSGGDDEALLDSLESLGASSSSMANKEGQQQNIVEGEKSKMEMGLLLDEPGESGGGGGGDGGSLPVGLSPGDESLDKGALSPLTGSYLLIVLAEPHSDEDRDIIIKRLNKGKMIREQILIFMML
jgi:hypothetical protein